MTLPRDTEAALTNQIVDLAHRLGFLAAHFRPARTAHGWRTPMQGDKGWPDLVLAKPGRLIVAELKSDTGRLAADQAKWLTTLREAPRPEVFLWRPHGFNSIVSVLRGRGPGYQPPEPITSRTNFAPGETKVNAHRIEFPTTRTTARAVHAEAAAMRMGAVVQAARDVWEHAITDNSNTMDPTIVNLGRALATFDDLKAEAR